MITVTMINCGFKILFKMINTYLIEFPIVPIIPNDEGGGNVIDKGGKNFVLSP